ncbi:hypothetical protein FRB95_001784 [Tulasnella sp. JGI-2019a]|nr:hypothetical protein FRB95_001784 [Tulasnella sp. JGI-2019a]
MKKKAARLAKRFFPIESLPTEITVRILEHVVQPEDWTFDQLRNVALISKSFLSLVTSTPTLWAVAKYNGHSLVHPLIALENSKEAPLTVNMGEREYDEEDMYAKHNVMEFINAILDHSHRWQRVDFYSHYTAMILPKLAELRTPLLHTLVLCRHWGALEGRRFSLMDAPRLRNLRLIRVMIVGSDGALARLQDLSVTSLQTTLDGITSGTILKTISACSMLEHLQLKDLDLMQPTRDPDAPELEPIHLPHLKVLHIFTVSSSIVSPLSIRIRAERLKVLCIVCSTHETSLDLLRSIVGSEEGLAHLISSGRLCDPAASVHIVDHDSGVRVCCIPSAPSTATPVSFDLSLGGVTLSEVYPHHLARILPPAPLDVLLTHDVHSPETLFTPMYMLRKLDIRSEDDSASNIIRSLTKPGRYGVNGSRQWLLPNMEELVLTTNAYKSDEELLLFLLGRYGTDSRSPPGRYMEDDWEGDRPSLAPLRSLKIMDFYLPDTRTAQLVLDVADIIVPAGHDWKQEPALNAMHIVVGQAKTDRDGCWAMQRCFLLVLHVALITSNFVAIIFASVLGVFQVDWEGGYRSDEPCYSIIKACAGLTCHQIRRASWRMHLLMFQCDLLLIVQSIG